MNGKGVRNRFSILPLRFPAGSVPAVTTVPDTFSSPVTTVPDTFSSPELAPIVRVRSPFELTSDESVTLAAGGNLLVGMRCNETPGAIRIGATRAMCLPGAPAPYANDLHNAQAPPVIAGCSILTTKFGQITCVRGH